MATHFYIVLSGPSVFAQGLSLRQSITESNFRNKVIDI